LAASCTSALARARFPAPSHPRMVTHARSPSRAAGRCRYPNPIHSDTSRHETAATPAGDSDLALHLGETPKLPARPRRWETQRPDAAVTLGRPQTPRPSRTIPPHRPQPPRRVGACGPGHDAPKRAEPESVPRLRMGTPARRILGRGPHHPRFREEERDLPRPRCLPSVRTDSPEEPPRQPPLPVTGDTDGLFRGSIRSTGGRDEPYLYPGMVLSTACGQAVEDLRRLFQPHCFHSP